MSRRGTPRTGLLFSSAVTTTLTLMNYTRGLVQAFTFLILLATLATLIPYVLSSLAAVAIALRQRALGRAGAMGALVVALLAFLYAMVAIIGAGKDAVYWGFVLLMGGLPIYIAMTWRRDAAG